MSFAISELLADFLAVALAGAAIKLMDDYLDFAQDTAYGRPSLAHVLGSGIVPYALVFALLASGINANLAAPLVLAAYAVGMLKDPRQMLPLGLPAWVESALAAAATCLLFGWRPTCVSIALMVAVQLADDLYDWTRERITSSTNLARITGKGTAFLLAVIAVLTALVLDLRTTVLVCVCAPVIAAAAHVVGASGGESGDD
ncbi:MAG: hypothetical protein AB1774_03385 [Bacillota bacterium]